MHVEWVVDVMLQKKQFSKPKEKCMVFPKRKETLDCKLGFLKFYKHVLLFADEDL